MADGLLVHKDMRFLSAAWTLIGTETALPKKLGQEEVACLREVSDIFYAGLAWRRFRAGELAKEYVPDLALKAYAILLLSHGPKEADWKRVRNAVATLNAVVVGQRPEALAVADASRLCTDVGGYLQQLKINAVRADDDDS